MRQPAPVVFINGLIGTLDYQALHATLAPHPVLAPALPGYGSLDGMSPDGIDIPAQISHLHRLLTEQMAGERVHLVGHSVGGVIAQLYTCQYPDAIASVISVEGNFSLKDAFWSSSVARMSSAEVEALMAGFRADPAGWLTRTGITPNPRHLETAAAWLAYQPASTLQAMARSVVAVTGESSYAATLQTLFARTPVHLLAGEHSRDGWDVPEWALAQAASFTVMPGAGHLMMLEQPGQFARVIRQILDSTGPRSSTECIF
ncbi:alpha/beta fold hydrolase [Pseudomonas sp. 148P]|uniref:Alpha/beta fold hydrolase n=1 Tax=Pseudomonas ulcerans TaxID=3115852 RepID=A0ABU7HYY3_9PSED|nr:MULTISPECIES: alpha/beta fold hydrolase [unclassified Pseudomonas]MEE1925318.1 alpha/beta fold hydrolase [Pseudomonas sp. 147P]MEE1936772.1 alpha/beta fold hydrolase [Pseudomonas sp. 148P]